MKSYLLIITAILLWSIHASGQIVTIPDPNFVTFLNSNGFAGAMTGNQMDTQHPSVQNATSVDCLSSNITDLEGIQYFSNLTTLVCSDNPLTNLPAIPPGVTHFECTNCLLTSLPALPSNLVTMQCGNNALTQLPVLPSTMVTLNCSNNMLTSLPTLPPGLLSLSCSFNSISPFPAILPSNLNDLNCGDNGITQLPALPSTLISLICSYNNLDSLPALPANLMLLHCNNNQVPALPALPLSIQTLLCFDNLLTALPALPSSLTFFNCSNNPLTVLPALPSGLQFLFANNTLLTTLPALPPGLLYLHCQHSLLSSLPALPSGIQDVFVGFNQLTSLAALPPVVYSLYVNDNPNLVCFPQLTQVGNLEFDNTGITCLPNYGNVLSSYPDITTLPLCDIFNTNGCDFYYNIAGQVFNDTNSNCINETGEALLDNLKINLYQGGNLLQQVITLQDGSYDIDVPYGTYDYSVDTVGMPFSVNCPASGFLTSVISALDSTDTDMDFGLQCVPGFDVGVHTISGGHFKPGDTSIVRVIAGDLSQLYNMICASGISGTIQINFSGPVSYVSPAPGSLTPVTGPNSLLYTIPDFGVVSPISGFNFFMATDSLAQLGDTVCFTVDVTPVSGDFNASNNQFVFCDDVVNSFDPNDKRVYPKGEIAQLQPWLTYTINFQNTGNAPAQHVVITDTLDSKLQEGTFTLLDASHEVFTVVNGNIVNFTFANINLPDSINNEPDSHGYVQFKLKPVTTLQPGDSIQNTAAIYFDFNPPVITNTVTNHVGQPLALNEFSNASIKVFPNPAHDEFNLVTPFNAFDYELIDLIGRTVMKGNFAGTENKINIRNLPSGCYILKVKKDSVQVVEKVNVY